MQSNLVFDVEHVPHGWVQKEPEVIVVTRLEWANLEEHKEQLHHPMYHVIYHNTYKGILLSALILISVNLNKMK